MKDVKQDEAVVGCSRCAARDLAEELSSQESAMGRPKKDPSTLRGKQLNLNVTKDEKAKILEGHILAGEERSPWLRRVLLEAAVAARAEKWLRDNSSGQAEEPVTAIP